MSRSTDFCSPTFVNLILYYYDTKNPKKPHYAANPIRRVSAHPESLTALTKEENRAKINVYGGSVGRKVGNS
jgi:hypothetical protein